MACFWLDVVADLIRQHRKNALNLLPIGVKNQWKLLYTYRPYGTQDGQYTNPSFNPRNLRNPCNPRFAAYSTKCDVHSDNQQLPHPIKFLTFIKPHQLPRRLIRRLRLGIEPVDTAHGWRSAFDNLWLEVMHEVEHRLNKRPTTETD